MYFQEKYIVLYSGQYGIIFFVIKYICNTFFFFLVSNFEKLFSASA